MEQLDVKITRHPNGFRVVMEVDGEELRCSMATQGTDHALREVVASVEPDRFGEKPTPEPLLRLVKEEP